MLITETPLTTSCLEKLCNKIPSFCGVFSCDSIPVILRRPACFIVNTDPAGAPGEHWVSIVLKKDRKALYFDGLGFPPIVPQIQHYLACHASKGFKYNCLTLMDPENKGCGYYAALFLDCWSRGCTMRQFQGYFRGRVGNELFENDLLINEVYR